MVWLVAVFLEGQGSAQMEGRLQAVSGKVQGAHLLGAATLLPAVMRSAPAAAAATPLPPTPPPPPPPRSPELEVPSAALRVGPRLCLLHTLGDTLPRWESPPRGGLGEGPRVCRRPSGGGGWGTLRACKGFQNTHSVHGTVYLPLCPSRAMPRSCGGGALTRPGRAPYIP